MVGAYVVTTDNLGVEELVAMGKIGVTVLLGGPALVTMSVVLPAWVVAVVVLAALTAGVVRDPNVLEYLSRRRAARLSPQAHRQVIEHMSAEKATEAHGEVPELELSARVQLALDSTDATSYEDGSSRSYSSTL